MAIHVNHDLDMTHAFAAFLVAVQIFIFSSFYLDWDETYWRYGKMTHSAGSAWMPEE
jgi:hypothetical protein